MAALKRTSAEMDVSEVAEPSPTMNLHAVMTALSPMKKSKHCAYFDGEVTDGKSSMRIFGFHSEVRKKLAAFEEDKTPVLDRRLVNGKRNCNSFMEE